MARASAPHQTRLSTERIVDVALDLLDTGGESGLTFRALGRELGTDPTAVYRYFRSKDDLLLAMADRVIDRALTDQIPQPDWRATIRQGCLAAYQALLRHPRLAVLVSARTTQGPAEAQAIERTLGTLVDAGLPPAEAVEVWRALGDTTLAWAGMTATYLSLPPEVRAKDDAAWTHTYASQSAALYPHLAAAAPHIVVTATKNPFPLALELMLDGIAARISAHTDRSPHA